MRRFLLLVLALAIAGFLVVGLLSASQTSAKSKKNARLGVWSGTATYTSPPDFGGEGSGAGGIEYQSAIVIRTRPAGHGVVRVSGVVATVRTYCPGPAVRDIRLLESPERGPKVSKSGGFSFRAEGVTINGHLGRSGGSGHIRASVGGCELHEGEWKAKKQRF